MKQVHFHMSFNMIYFFRKEGHIPSKVNYDMSEILRDLLNFAAKFLHIGGRLIYWLPVYRPE